MFTTCATSSGSAKVPVGTLFWYLRTKSVTDFEKDDGSLETHSSLTFASAQAFLPKAVQTGPGLTLLEVIHFGPHSRAILRVKQRSRALLAQ